ncbi:MAG TPA: hypothetical protein PLI53_02455, partial [Geobacteraceae bacterium]|nr:hypothetical protein [Geobacteraceae bacterium]
MLVEVSKSFKLRGQTLKVGTVLDVPEESLDRLGAKVAPIGIAVAEREYFRALSRWWEIDEDPTITDDEARRLLARLDELYQMLHQQGRKVPVRLPLERTRGVA